MRDNWTAPGTGDYHEEIQMNEFLRPAEVAPMLNITTGRLYQLLASREIPSVKVGGAIRIPRQAWEQWLADQRDKALEAVRRG